MFGYTDAPRAWWKTRGMARLAGVDLPRAVVEGWLTRKELSGLVDRCAACAEAARCAQWLGHAGSVGGAGKGIAAFCPNRGTLEALIPH